MWLPKLALLFLTLALLQSPTFAVKKSYIVYLGAHSHGPDASVTDLKLATDFHYEFLASFVGSTDKAKDAIFYSYQYNINGFAAMLEEEAAAQIAKDPKVVSVFLNKARKLHTTHSWEFMLLEKEGRIHNASIWKQSRFGEDTIIANIDTGVWPESKSFSDEGYGPIPTKWKGNCQNNTLLGAPCNRKLIGARYYNKGYLMNGGSVESCQLSARDFDGHGTRTLSTAGGNFVSGASVFGVGLGTAKGGSPRARVAAYKACWAPVNGSSECIDSDILAAIDDAIHDGVDVISMSLGRDPDNYFDDPTSIGAFHAVQSGIVVVCSAGNEGPTSETVTNVSPWILTVGASTIDREFQSYVELRSGQRLKGASLSGPLPEARFYQLITGTQAKSANATDSDALMCNAGSLDPVKVKGKILVCLTGVLARMEKGYQASLAGAVGMILCNDESSGNEIIADPHLLPATHISYKDGVAVFNYITSTDDPLGFFTIPSAVYGTKPAPFMASFSSSGPNPVTPEILKPDITAPGVDIIAAFTEAKSPSDLDFDTRRTRFNVESGTSISCPHVAGVAGLLKTLHPDWSPAAIKSAIMTTARVKDNVPEPVMRNGSLLSASPFNFGSGHMRPNRAQDPGLVYDISAKDYLDFLCGIGYDSRMIKPFSPGYKCNSSYQLYDFNYPAITIPYLTYPHTVTRKLKNVGSPGTYRVRIHHPLGVRVTVEPSVLEFKKIGEEKSFKVTMNPKKPLVPQQYKFGGLVWSDGSHYVRSPIVVGNT